MEQNFIDNGDNQGFFGDTKKVVTQVNDSQVQYKGNRNSLERLLMHLPNGTELSKPVE